MATGTDEAAAAALGELIALLDRALSAAGRTARIRAAAEHTRADGPLRERRTRALAMAADEEQRARLRLVERLAPLARLEAVRRELLGLADLPETSTACGAENADAKEQDLTERTA